MGGHADGNFPQGNWSAPCKLGPRNTQPGQLLECLLHPGCRSGSQVVHRASVDRFVCSRREVGAQHGMVSSIRHRISTTRSQFFTCPNSPAWNVVQDPVCKPRWYQLCSPPWEHLVLRRGADGSVWSPGCKPQNSASTYHIVHGSPERKSLCFGPVSVLEAAIPKQICFELEIQICPCLLRVEGRPVKLM